jgi:magnesium transporter
MPLRGNSVAGVLLRLLYHATQHFLQHLRLIHNISDEIEKKIEYAVTNKSLVNVFSLKKSLTYYESATSANQLLLGKLRDDAARIGFRTEELEFLEDIGIENKQCDNLAKIYAETLENMSDARSSVASNNLSTIMKYLAVINIVFLPLTVITGIGGMSEFTMMTEGIWWPHAYAALIVVMVIIGFVTYRLVHDIGAPRNTRRR